MEEKVIDKWYNLSKLSLSQSVSGEIHLLLEFKGMLNQKKGDTVSLDNNNKSTSTKHRIVVERNTRNRDRKSITIHNQLSHKEEKEYYERRLFNSDIYKSRTLSSVLPRTFDILEKTKTGKQKELNDNYLFQDKLRNSKGPSRHVKGGNGLHNRKKENKSLNNSHKSEKKLMRLNTEETVSNEEVVEDEKNVLSDVTESSYSNESDIDDSDSEISEEFLEDKSQQQEEKALETENDRQNLTKDLNQNDEVQNNSKTSTEIKIERLSEDDIDRSIELKKSSSANLLKSLTHEKNTDNVEDMVILATRGSLKKLK